MNENVKYPRKLYVSYRQRRWWRCGGGDQPTSTWYFTVFQLLYLICLAVIYIYCAQITCLVNALNDSLPNNCPKYGRDAAVSFGALEFRMEQLYTFTFTQWHWMWNSVNKSSKKVEKCDFHINGWKKMIRYQRKQIWVAHLYQSYLLVNLEIMELKPEVLSNTYPIWWRCAHKLRSIRKAREREIQRFCPYFDNQTE